MGRRVSQALTSSLGFQRELERVTEQQRERKKVEGGGGVGGDRERETTQINVVITCMHTTGTVGRGKIRKKAVFGELLLLLKPPKTRALDCLRRSAALSFFPDSG